MLLSQAFSAERQNYQPRAIDEHGRTAPIRVYPYTRRMHILHKAIPKFRLLKVVERQGLQVMGAWVILHH